MDDLLPGVDRTKYYRYLGSLTTPNCDEGVIWTIFKDPIKVSQDLVSLDSIHEYLALNSIFLYLGCTKNCISFNRLKLNVTPVMHKISIKKKIKCTSLVIVRASGFSIFN